MFAQSQTRVLFPRGGLHRPKNFWDLLHTNVCPNGMTNSNHLFIERQHAMHAERDIVMANPSVCLSNTWPIGLLCLNEWTYLTFLQYFKF